MAQYINTNISSLNSQRNLGKSQNTLATSLQRLTTGLRINSAKDDAAGMAISERMSSQIAGLNQASRNANDGISLAQTAEGAMTEVTTNLQRMRELALQSSNASNTDADRATLQAELSQLLQQVDATSTTTQFNGKALLDGGFGSQKFQIGANSNQSVSVNLGSTRTADLGGGQTAAVSTRAMTTSAALNAGDLILNGVAISASSSTDDQASYVGQAGSAIAKAAAINRASSQTGVTATVNENVMTGYKQSASGASASGALVINGVSTANISLSSDYATSRATVISAINNISGQTGVVAVDDGADGGVSLHAADGRNISVVLAGVAGTFDNTTLGISSASATSGYAMGSVSLNSSKDIHIQQGASSSGNIENIGLVEGTFKTQKAVAIIDDTAAAFAAGDFKINGVLVGATSTTTDTASSVNKNYSAISKAAAINSISAQTGVTAKAAENSINFAGYGQTMATSTVSGLIQVNGVNTASLSMSGLTTDQARAATVSAINAISGQTGVTAVDSGNATDGVKLVAADGRNISVTLSGGLTSAATGVAGATGAATVSYGKVLMESASAIKIDKGSSSNAMSTIGVQSGTYGSGKSGQSLSTINISTADGANKALTAIDNALATLNSMRSDMGAVQNRFTSTVSMLQSSSENLTAARSRIQDTDFASETAAMSRSQILQQAGTAMLAQANQLPNGVLSLLRG